MASVEKVSPEEYSSLRKWYRWSNRSSSTFNKIKHLNASMNRKSRNAALYSSTRWSGGENKL